MRYVVLRYSALYHWIYSSCLVFIQHFSTIKICDVRDVVHAFRMLEHDEDWSERFVVHQYWTMSGSVPSSSMFQDSSCKCARTRLKNHCSCFCSCCSCCCRYEAVKRAGPRTQNLPLFAPQHLNLIFSTVDFVSRLGVSRLSFITVRSIVLLALSISTSTVLAFSSIQMWSLSHWTDKISFDFKTINKNIRINHKCRRREW